MPPPGRSWTAWAVPDLSLTAALAAIAFCLFIYQAPWRLFADSDPGWHIVTGERILTTGRIPHSDPFSFLQTGHAWYAWEWASEILMALFHRWQGLTGVVFLFTMVIGLTIWLCFRLHRRLGGDFFLACVMASPLVATAKLHWLARPHVLSYLFLLGTVFYFEQAAGRFRVRDGLVLGIGTAVWAGVHGSFPMVIALALLYAAGHAARALLWKDLDTVEEWRRTGWFLLAALCAGAGSLLNPYGLALHRHLLEFTFHPELRGAVLEWEPFNFAHTGSGQILITAALGGLGALLALRQRNVPHALVIGFLVALGLKYARGLPVLALLGLPLANAAITRTLEAGKGAFLRGLMGISAELRRLDRNQHGGALAALAALAVLGWLHQPAVEARTGFSPETYPAAAYEAIAGLPASSRIFASPIDGGYICYRSNGTRKIWIDGRVDYFGPAPYLQFQQILLTKPGWKETLREVGFTHAVLETRRPLAAALDQAGWRQLYRDRRVAVWERPDAELRLNALNPPRSHLRPRTRCFPPPARTEPRLFPCGEPFTLNLDRAWSQASLSPQIWNWPLNWKPHSRKSARWSSFVSLMITRPSTTWGA